MHSFKFFNIIFLHRIEMLCRSRIRTGVTQENIDESISMTARCVTIFNIVCTTKHTMQHVLGGSQ